MLSSILTNTVCRNTFGAGRLPHRGRQNAYRHGAGVSKSLKELAAFLRFDVRASSRSTRHLQKPKRLLVLANLLKRLPDRRFRLRKFDEAVFCEEMKSAPVFESHAGNEIELNGWLEAPWLAPLAHSSLGMHRRGASGARRHASFPSRFPTARPGFAQQSPAIRSGHLSPALPSGNARPRSELKVTLSRTQIDGEPAKPSRLLFRCPDAELTARVHEPLRFRCLHAHNTRSREDMAA